MPNNSPVNWFCACIAGISQFEYYIFIYIDVHEIVQRLLTRVIFFTRTEHAAPLSDLIVFSVQNIIPTYTCGVHSSSRSYRSNIPPLRPRLNSKTTPEFSWACSSLKCCKGRFVFRIVILFYIFYFPFYYLLLVTSLPTLIFSSLHSYYIHSIINFISSSGFLVQINFYSGYIIIIYFFK